jgi:hypothetical protein
MKTDMNAKTLAMALGAACAVWLAVPADASAQAPTRIKQNNAWGSYSHSGSSGKICYILSIPTEKLPADRDHGDVFFMLARHPGQAGGIEPQFTAGYAFKDNSKVILDIDGRKFTMFTQGDKAWLENPAEESAVVDAMRSGRAMSVTAESRRGTQTNYKYSLSGVTASLDDIKTCQ